MLSNRWCASPTAKREACRRPDKERCVGRSCRFTILILPLHWPLLRIRGPCRYRRRIPCKKRRELIKKVREADPLRCPEVLTEMRIVSLIDEKDVIERILRHLVLRKERCACIPPPTRRATPFSIRGSTTLPRLPH
jgi:hypothetical protein